jgi:hypothetical protein
LGTVEFEVVVLDLYPTVTRADLITAQQGFC